MKILLRSMLTQHILALITCACVFVDEFSLFVRPRRPARQCLIRIPLAGDIILSDILFTSLYLLL